MRGSLNQMPLLLCGLFVGCALGSPMTFGPNGLVVDGRLKPDGTVEHVYDKELLDEMFPPDAVTSFGADGSHTIREMLVRTRPGAGVGLRDDLERTHNGYYLRMSGGEVVLLSCITKEAIPQPGSGLQARSTFTPIQSLRLSTLVEGHVKSLPDKNFSGEMDASDQILDSLVFMSGRRQHVQLVPPEDADPPTEAPSAVEPTTAN